MWVPLECNSMTLGNLFMAVCVHCLGQCLEHTWHKINTYYVNILTDAECFLRCITESFQTYSHQRYQRCELQTISLPLHHKVIRDFLPWGNSSFQLSIKQLLRTCSGPDVRLDTEKTEPAEWPLWGLQTSLKLCDMWRWLLNYFLWCQRYWQGKNSGESVRF